MDALRAMSKAEVTPVVIVNHPSRSRQGLGVYGANRPRELRNWNDAVPRVAVGMEGALGHQAASIRPDGTADTCAEGGLPRVVASPDRSRQNLAGHLDIPMLEARSGKEHRMKTGLSWAAIATFALVGCATPEAKVIEGAAEAMGGSEAVLGATTLVMEGTGTTYRLGQNTSPEADAPIYEVTSYKKQVDLQNHRWRMEQVRDGKFLTGNPVNQQPLVQAMDADVAFDVGADGAAQRLGAQVAKDRHAEFYHHPLVLLQAALAEPATVSNPRQEGGNDVVDVVIADGSRLTLHVNAETKLPVMIQSTSYDANWGDVVIATSFSDYADAGGLQLPQTISQKLDRYANGDFKVTNRVNAEIAAPADVAAAPLPTPAPVTTAADELAPGVWYIGPGYNSVLIEFPTYTALVEAPQNDARALAVIQKARELVPDKPLKYAINTHFHIDHSGGVRAAVAEGLTLITHEAHRKYFEDVVARPHTVMQDHLAKNPKPLTIETIAGDGPFELTEGDRTAVIYRLKDDVHADGMLMIYLPRERILIEGDAFTPAARAAPFAGNLLKQVRDLGLRVDRIAPIHGYVVPFSELVKTVAAQAPTG